jgi:hypothetical protein
MAKILKCASCQGVMDVTSVSPGTTVRCPDCGQTSKVPSGNTSLRTKTVSPPIPPPVAAPAARERGTRVQQRRASGTQPAQAPPKSNSGLFVGLAIGAVAVIAVVAFFMMKETPHEPPAKVTQIGPKDPVVFKPNLPAQSDKPIVLGSGSTGKEEPKTTPLAGKVENVDNVNWDHLMRDLRPGGGFEHLDRPEGVAFQKVKGFGKPAYPKLIKYIDDEDGAIATAAVAVLNALTGRDSALPRGVNKAKIKAEWEEWLKSSADAK